MDHRAWGCKPGSVDGYTVIKHGNELTPIFHQVNSNTKSNILILNPNLLVARIWLVSAVKITDNEKKLQSILDKYSINVSSRFRVRDRE